MVAVDAAGDNLAYIRFVYLSILYGGDNRFLSHVGGASV